MQIDLTVRRSFQFYSEDGHLKSLCQQSENLSPPFSFSTKQCRDINCCWSSTWKLEILSFAIQPYRSSDENSCNFMITMVCDGILLPFSYCRCSMYRVPRYFSKNFLRKIFPLSAAEYKTSHCHISTKLLSYSPQRRTMK